MTSPQFSGDGLEERMDAVLDSMESAANYNDWVVSLFEPYLSGTICEIGAGTGTITERIAASGDVIALEPSSIGVRKLSNRFNGDDRISVVQGTAEDLRPTSVNSVVMSNVLEHIEDDAGTLSSIFDSLMPGGHLVVFCPAFMFLYTEIDRSIGHVRRYRLAELEAKLKAAGFEVQERRYVNPLGAIAWFIVGKVLRRPQTENGLVRVWDRTVVPVTRWVERRVRFPFGQSVLVVGRKPQASLV